MEELNGVSYSDDHARNSNINAFDFLQLSSLIFSDDNYIFMGQGISYCIAFLLSFKMSYDRPSYLNPFSKKVPKIFPIKVIYKFLDCTLSGQ